MRVVFRRKSGSRLSVDEIPTGPVAVGALQPTVCRASCCACAVSTSKCCVVSGRRQRRQQREALAAVVVVAVVVVQLLQLALSSIHVRYAGTTKPARLRQPPLGAATNTAITTAPTRCYLGTLFRPSGCSLAPKFPYFQLQSGEKGRARRKYFAFLFLSRDMPCRHKNLRKTNRRTYIVKRKSKFLTGYINSCLLYTSPSPRD